MKIRDMLSLGKRVVVSAQCELVLCDILNIDQFDLYEQLDKNINDNLCINYFLSLTDLMDGKPKSSVIDHIKFCNNDYYLSDDVLTPHIQTQEMTYYMINTIQEYFNKEVSILDMCCGSGVIGLSLGKKINNSKITLADISSDALSVAKYNSEKTGVDSEIIKTDLFSNIDNTFDVIVCNPPYLETPEDNSFLDNEPLISMKANAGGYEFYYRLLAQIKDYLKEKYLITLEYGEGQKDTVNDIAKEFLKDSVRENLKSMKGDERSLFILGGFEELEQKKLRKVLTNKMR